MADTILEIHIPSPLLQLGIPREDVEKRVIEWLVLSLFTDGRISSGKAARLMNISRVEFLTLLREHKISFVDYSEDELADEIASARSLPDPKSA